MAKPKLSKKQIRKIVELMMPLYNDDTDALTEKQREAILYTIVTLSRISDPAWKYPGWE